MKRMLTVGTLVALAAGLALAQQRDNTPRQMPPFFKGEKKDKDEDQRMRSLQGLVRDPSENPAEGAVVQLKDTKTLQVRSFITKSDGAYSFHGLSTNIDYEVKADRQGASSETKMLSVFDSRKTAVINLKLESKKQ